MIVITLFLAETSSESILDSFCRNLSLKINVGGIFLVSAISSLHIKISLFLFDSFFSLFFILNSFNDLFPKSASFFENKNTFFKSLAFFSIFI